MRLSFLSLFIPESFCFICQRQKWRLLIQISLWKWKWHVIAVIQLLCSYWSPSNKARHSNAYKRMIVPILILISWCLCRSTSAHDYQIQCVQFDRIGTVAIVQQTPDSNRACRRRGNDCSNQSGQEEGEQQTTLNIGTYLTLENRII